MNQIIKFIDALNQFCFSKNHNDNCDGCIFKSCKKCPLNTVVDKLEVKSINKYNEIESYQNTL